MPEIPFVLCQCIWNGGDAHEPLIGCYYPLRPFDSLRKRARLTALQWTRTDPLGHTTSLGYDAAGNLTTLTNPLSQATTLTYSTSGQPLTITTPAGTTALGYDQGDVATITDPVGNLTRRFTDDGGRLTS